MATSAAIGWDSEFAIGDGGSPEVFTDVAEVTAISPANYSRDTVDATHMASPEAWREYVVGLNEPGEVSITLNYIPGGSADDAMRAAFTVRTAKNFRVTYPNAETDVFSGFCVGTTREVPLGDKMTMTARFKLTGKPAFMP